VIETLQYLKSVAPREPQTGKESRPGKSIDPSVFFGFVSSRGLFFSDVLGGAPGQVSLDQLKKALKMQRGLVYRYLVGVTADVAGYPDLSRIPFEIHNDVVTATLASYNLTFVKEERLFRLQRIESTDPGGD